MIKTWILNSISILFKLISLFNLTLRGLRKKRYPGAFIVSIDNLAFGGTGKTPLVIHIGQQLAKAGIKFCIITRGYRSAFEKQGIRVEQHHRIDQIGDEAGLYRSYFPESDIFIGKNRFRSIERAIENQNQVLLMDDGFQTTGLVKDFRVMLLNPGHHYYYLRNFRWLARNSDTRLSYTSKPDPGRDEYTFKTVGIFDGNGNALSLESQKKHRVIGFSGLGDNRRFRQTVEKMGFDLVRFHDFRDHYHFSVQTLKTLMTDLESHRCNHILCSEKDYIKIKALNVDNIPLIFIKNSIKLGLNLTENMIRNAEKKGIIKT